jgi:hypothetical protein
MSVLDKMGWGARIAALRCHYDVNNLTIHFISQIKTSLREALKSVFHQVQTFFVQVVMIPLMEKWKGPGVYCWKMKCVKSWQS